MSKHNETEVPTNQSIVVVRKNSTTFDENDDVWRLAKKTLINVARLKLLYDDDLHEGLIKTLSWYATNVAPQTTLRKSHALLYFAKHTGFRRFDKTALLSFKTLYARYASYLRIVILKWHALGYPGLDENVALIKRWKFKPVESYKSIKKLDPKYGP